MVLAIGTIILLFLVFGFSIGVYFLVGIWTKKLKLRLFIAIPAGFVLTFGLLALLVYAELIERSALTNTKNDLRRAMIIEDNVTIFDFKNQQFDVINHLNVGTEVYVTHDSIQTTMDSTWLKRVIWKDSSVYVANYSVAVGGKIGVVVNGYAYMSPTSELKPLGNVGARSLEKLVITGTGDSWVRVAKRLVGKRRDLYIPIESISTDPLELELVDLIPPAVEAYNNGNRDALRSLKKSYRYMPTKVYKIQFGDEPWSGSREDIARLDAEGKITPGVDRIISYKGVVESSTDTITMTIYLRDSTAWGYGTMPDKSVHNLDGYFDISEETLTIDWKTYMNGLTTIASFVGSMNNDAWNGDWYVVQDGKKARQGKISFISLWDNPGYLFGMTYHKVKDGDHWKIQGWLNIYDEAGQRLEFIGVGDDSGPVYQAKDDQNCFVISEQDINGDSYPDIGLLNLGNFEGDHVVQWWRFDPKSKYFEAADVTAPGVYSERGILSSSALIRVEDHGDDGNDGGNGRR